MEPRRPSIGDIFSPRDYGAAQQAAMGQQQNHVRNLLVLENRLINKDPDVQLADQDIAQLDAMFRQYVGRPLGSREGQEQPAYAIDPQGTDFGDKARAALAGAVNGLAFGLPEWIPGVRDWWRNEFANLDEHPDAAGAYTGGNIGGGLLSILVPGGIVAKGASAAGKAGFLARNLAKFGPSAISGTKEAGWLASAAKGAVTGAAFGAIEGGADITRAPNERISMSGVASGGLSGLVGGAVLGGLAGKFSSVDRLHKVMNKRIRSRKLGRNMKEGERLIDDLSDGTQDVANNAIKTFEEGVGPKGWKGPKRMLGDENNPDRYLGTNYSKYGREHVERTMGEDISEAYTGLANQHSNTRFNNLANQEDRDLLIQFHNAAAEHNAVRNRVRVLNNKRVLSEAEETELIHLKEYEDAIFEEMSDLGKDVKLTFDRTIDEAVGRMVARGEESAGLTRVNDIMETLKDKKFFRLTTSGHKESVEANLRRMVSMHNDDALVQTIKAMPEEDLQKFVSALASSNDASQVSRVFKNALGDYWTTRAKLFSQEAKWVGRATAEAERFGGDITTSAKEVIDAAVQSGVIKQSQAEHIYEVLNRSVDKTAAQRVIDTLEARVKAVGDRNFYTRGPWRKAAKGTRRPKRGSAEDRMGKEPENFRKLMDDLETELSPKASTEPKPSGSAAGSEGDEGVLNVKGEMSPEESEALRQSTDLASAEAEQEKALRDMGIT